MGVHRHRRLAEGHVQHHIRCFSAHAGQGLERFTRAGHFALVLPDQDLTGRHQMARLAAVQANGLDVTLQGGQTQVQDLLRRVGHGEQPARGLVHPHVGRLGGEQDRCQQLEHARILQLGVGLRVGRLQGGEKRFDVLCLHAFIFQK